MLNYRLNQLQQLNTKLTILIYALLTLEVFARIVEHNEGKEKIN